MVLNATVNNISVISWRSVLLVEETEGPQDHLCRFDVTFWNDLTNTVLIMPDITCREYKYRQKENEHVLGIFWKIYTLQKKRNATCEKI